MFAEALVVAATGFVAQPQSETAVTLAFGIYPAPVLTLARLAARSLL